MASTKDASPEVTKIKKPKKDKSEKKDKSLKKDKSAKKRKSTEPVLGGLFWGEGVVWAAEA